MSELTVDDETIRAAIAQNDDPDHPDALTVDEVQELLDYLQKGSEIAFDVYMDHVENGDAQVVHEDKELIILSTGEHNWVSEELGMYEGDVTVDKTAKTVVTQIFHSLARDRCDHNWSTSYPFVIAKPEDFDAGQYYVEAIVNGLQNRGLSPGQAWAVYGVRIRDNSMNAWGHRKGDHDHKNVSDALEKAGDKIPLP